MTDTPTPETETTESKDALAFNEALVPDLSNDAFELLGHIIQIKPLKLQFQIEFAKIVEEYATSAAYEAQQGSYLSALTVAFRHVDIVPRLIHVIVKNHGAPIEYEALMQSDVDIQVLIGHLIAFARKNEKVGRPVLDFFERIMPTGKDELEALLNGMKTMIQKKVTAFTSTAS